MRVKTDAKRREIVATAWEVFRAKGLEIAQMWDAADGKLLRREAIVGLISTPASSTIMKRSILTPPVAMSTSTSQTAAPVGCAGIRPLKLAVAPSGARRATSNRLVD